MYNSEMTETNQSKLEKNRILEQEFEEKMDRIKLLQIEASKRDIKLYPLEYLAWKKHYERVEKSIRIVTPSERLRRDFVPSFDGEEIVYPPKGEEDLEKDRAFDVSRSFNIS